MSEPPVPQTVIAAQRPRRRKRRLVLIVAGLITLLVAALAGLFFYNQHLAETALDEAIAEADRLDPGWRLEDIDKQRTAVPLEQNAAVHIHASATLVSGIVLGLSNDELQIISEEPPQFQIDPEIAGKLRKVMDRLLQAEALAHKAAPLKTGWYPYQWTPNIIGTLVPHVEQVREVGEHLNYLAMLQSQDGKHDEAWQTSLTILCVPRSFGEDPFLITALVRMGLRARSVASFERCLAHGTVSDTLLAEAQRQLAEEAKEPIFLHALRGERATMDAMMTNLEAGRIKLIDIFPPGSVSEIEWLYRIPGHSAKKDHAWILRFLTEAVENAKLPPTQMRAKMQELEPKFKDGPLLTHFLMPPVPRLAGSVVRSQVLLDCAVAGIGVERFRMQHGRWPDSLDEVVAAKLLDKVPTDYFDGKPLRYRKATDGVVVYSISQKGNYAGDALDTGKTFDSRFDRIEFRLWDEKHRRQPTRPRPKGDGEKDGGEMR
jgi:hypothetical protein